MKGFVKVYFTGNKKNPVCCEKANETTRKKAPDLLRYKEFSGAFLKGNN